MIATWMDLLQQFLFDPSFVDLIIWYPNLTWSEFLMSAILVLAWRLVTNRIEKFISYHARRALAWALFELAILVKP